MVRGQTAAHATEAFALGATSLPTSTKSHAQLHALDLVRVDLPVPGPYGL